MKDYSKTRMNYIFHADIKCPLCKEKMDFSDKNTLPCPCGYQICLFCYHNLTEKKGACPCCTKTYKPTFIRNFIPKDRLNSLKKEYKDKAIAKENIPETRKKPIQDLIEERKHLAAVRVVQKTLVYSIGIDISLAKESILMGEKYFGQFGKIIKMVINTRNHATQATGAGVYVTYSTEAAADRAIEMLDGSVYEGRVIRVTNGTTKYCSNFLKGIACTIVDCMYLHSEGKETDSYTKRQMNNTKDFFISYTINKKDQPSMREFGTIFSKKQENIEEDDSYPISEVFGMHIYSQKKTSRQSVFNPFVGIFKNESGELSPEEKKRIVQEAVEERANIKEVVKEKKKKETFGVIGTPITKKANNKKKQ
eukprot:GHVP01054253.1.p1 GENE.GHVP01054253.1~~GHVP01054253.1.p1  ORF type:complete len:365 (-),score=63.91 GHVP01054253.1:661-1755(-)